MRPAGHRAERVADLIRAELGQILLHDVKDPRIGFTTVTEVRVSPDLRVAHVYVSVYGSAEIQHQTLEGLRAAHGFIRHEIAQRLKLRYAPEILFEYDRSVEQGARIEELIQKTKLDQNEKKASD